MTEPASVSTATATVATVTLASLFPGIPATIVLGSFAGAVMFVLTANDFSWGKKTLLFLASFAAGFLGAEMMSRLLEAVLPISSVDHGVGALVTGAIAVRLLLFVFARLEDPASLFPFLRGGRDR